MTKPRTTKLALFAGATALAALAPQVHAQSSDSLIDKLVDKGSLTVDEAKDLHAEQSTLATVAFLERNPKGFDHDDLLKQMFLKNALVKAQAERASEEAEFAAKQLHQKAEIGRIDILATRDNEVLTAVTGQIIRSGIFQDKAFTEAFPFTLRLRLIRNPNMSLNGRFPTAVGDFKYEINR